MTNASFSHRALAVLSAALSGLLLIVFAPAALGARTPTSIRVGSVPQLPLGAALLGPLSAATPMRITVALQPRDPAALSRYAEEVATPGSPLYRHYLTTAQFAHRFGATGPQVAAVDASLRAHGLTPGRVSANSLSIPVTASAGSLAHAFSLILSRVSLPGGLTAVVNSAAPALDATIAGLVQGVIGLDDLATMRPLQARESGAGSLSLGHSVAHVPAPHVATGGPQPCAAASQGASAQGSYTADQIASAYNFSGLYKTGDEGKGVTVAIYELEPDDPRDIAAFQSCYGTSASVSYTAVDGGAGSGAGGGEAALDIEQLIGLAPKANLLVYQGPNSNSNSPGAGPYDTFAAIVNQNRAKVVSISWGQCEPMEGSADAHAESTLFQQAAAQGQTLLSASGDSGSEDCDVGSVLPNTALAVDDPGSQPFVTSVGGTSLTAIGPPPKETVWNNGDSLTGLLGLVPGAAGGGVSQFWSMPSYQSGAPSSLGVIGSGSTGAPCGSSGGDCREVPDVSASADPFTGYTIYYNGSGTVSDVPTGWQATGGTSGAAPLWGALVALGDASSGCSGSPIGFLNPALYQAAAGHFAADFHDITSGNNDFTGSHGGTYPARPGYDVASGLGTPDASALVGDLCADTLRLADPGNRKSTVGKSVHLQLSAHGSGAVHITYQATGLPTGLRLNASTGLVSGRPRKAGKFTVKVTASDGSTGVRSVSFTWMIVKAKRKSAHRH